MDATFATKAPILAPIQVSQRAKYTMRIAVEWREGERERKKTLGGREESSSYQVIRGSLKWGG